MKYQARRLADIAEHFALLAEAQEAIARHYFRPRARGNQRPEWLVANAKAAGLRLAEQIIQQTELQPAKELEQ